jgi:putative membrane protein
MKKEPQPILTALKGMAMGMAEVIPGVSGGTIAFITGIYEKLIDSIKAFGPELIRGFRDGGIRGCLAAVNAPFLLFLLIGMAIGMVVGVFGVSHVLENYPPLLWAFFFGLIIASVIYLGRQVKPWRWQEWLLVVLGAVIAFGITQISPAEGSDALPMVFFAGVIAISALILPGISGSFILLIMGMYTVVIPAVKRVLETQNSDDLLLVGVFAVGCLIGLFSFSRVLSWLFHHYHNSTLVLLTGFMVGSLNKIWPWRNVLQYRTNSKGEEVPFLEANVWPGQYDGEPMLIGAILLFVIGFVVVFALERLGTKK